MQQTGDRMTELRRLDLSGNHLDSLPPSLWTLTGLQTLKLTDNCIVALSDDVARLTRLRVLHLGGNNLSSLPVDALLSLPHLEELVLAGNPQLHGGLGEAAESSLAGLARLADNGIGIVMDDSREGERGDGGDGDDRRDRRDVSIT